MLAIESQLAQPWEEADYRRHTIGRVAVIGEQIVGACVYALRPKKLLLVRLIVHQTVYRQGVGSAMIADLVAKLRHNRRTCIVVDAPDDSLALHLFLKANGFAAVNVLRGDTYRFVRWVVSSWPAPPATLRE